MSSSFTFKGDAQLDPEDKTPAAEEPANPTASVPQPARRPKPALPISITLGAGGGGEAEDAEMWE